MGKFTGSLLLLFVFTTACSVYRSQGRKDFDNQVNGSGYVVAVKNNSPQKPVSFSFSGNENCFPISSLEAWLGYESMPSESELIYQISEGNVSNLEIWKIYHDDEENSSVEIKTLLKKETGIISCHHQFPSEISWEEHKKQFITEAARAHE